MRFLALSATFALAAALPNPNPTPYDKILKIESSNYPGYFVGLENNRAQIQNKQCETNNWKIVKSLVGCDKCKCQSDEYCVSFQSTVDPKNYLRHRNYEIWSDPVDTADLYKNDASFCVAAPNNKKGGFVSFRSVNYPDRFIRHYGYKLYIDNAGQRNPNLFAEDTSFHYLDSTTSATVQATYDQVYSLESSNYPGYFVGLDNNRAQIQNKQCETNKWKVVKPLVGCDKCKCKPGEQCISFQSATQPSRYLRHRNYELWSDAVDAADLYKNDASFCVAAPNNNKAGYFSLRSVNYPDRFIRHYGYKLYIDNAGQRNPNLFAEDTSFHYVESTPSATVQVTYDQVYKVESSNYPGYFVGLDNNRAQIQNKQCDTNKWKIVKSLVGCDKCKCKPGEQCVSFQSATQPSRYLRHRNSELWSDAVDAADLYKNDASFCVAAPNNSKPGYFSLRSVNYPDRFIRHYGYKLYIDTAGQRNPNLFAEDTSFHVVNA